MNIIPGSKQQAGDFSITTDDGAAPGLVMIDMGIGTGGNKNADDVDIPALDSGEQGFILARMHVGTVDDGGLDDVDIALNSRVNQGSIWFFHFGILPIRAILSIARIAIVLRQTRERAGRLCDLLVRFEPFADAQSAIIALPTCPLAPRGSALQRGAPPQGLVHRFQANELARLD